MGSLVEVKLVRELVSDEVIGISERTGGRPVIERGVLWRIDYAQGDLLWAGYPHVPRDTSINVLLPYFNIRTPKSFGTTLNIYAACITEDSLKIISPNPNSETNICGYTFADGVFSSFNVAIEQASRPLVYARDLARHELSIFLAFSADRAKLTPKK